MKYPEENPVTDTEFKIRRQADVARSAGVTEFSLKQSEV